MRTSPRSLPLLSAGLVALGLALPLSGAVASVGAASAPSGPRPGGAEFGQPNGRPSAARPVASIFRIGHRALTEGTAPRMALRVDQRGVRTVAARVVFRPVRGAGRLVALDLGRIRTGRLLHPAWPAGTVLKAGRYVVALHATGPAGGTLRRRATASGRALLTVRAPKPPPAPKPAPAPAPAPVPTPAPAPAAAPAVPALPDPPVSAEGIFPVAGPHTFGGPDAVFGAGRTGHVHQGQDVVAAEGTPVLAPLAGTVVARDYQASGAGFYLTVDVPDGRSFFFAHCAKDTFAVALGQAVAAGQQLCRVGHTGDASGPHLHFEIWVGGWRRGSASRPVDPLAQLQAWEH
jgi:murein DD-endopeptidase MepM/ murein hydrolase activator NlpD